MSVSVPDISPLQGIVPEEWLMRDRRILENSLIIVALHHKPHRLGHCVMFPKKRHCKRLSDCEVDDLVAIGNCMPVIKRALRLVTGFQSYVFVMRSGKRAGQEIEHIYMEVIPTIASQPSFEINWDPSNERQQGTERRLTAPMAAKLVHIVRQSMGLNHFLGFKNMLYDTRYIIAEFVQHPSATGHFTVSPKNVSPDLEDASPVDIEGLLRDLPRITMALQKATGQTDFWVCLQNGPDAGQMGPHLNLQCVPCPERKKTVEIKMLGEPKIVSAESAKKLAEALRAVAGEDQLGNALGKPSQPAESSWRAPVMRRNVNPAGVSSPCIARARAPHPQLEEWAKKSGVREDERNVKPPLRPFMASAAHMLEGSSECNPKQMRTDSFRTGSNADSILRDLAVFMETYHR